MKRFLLKVLPANRHIYSFCRGYLDRMNGENNADIETNGELDLMQKTFGTFTTVFDVGAHVGDWTALALSINPRLAVHCFEPSRHTFELLTQKAFPDSVVLNNCGLSSSRGERILYLFGEGAGINSLYQRQGLEDGWNLETQTLTETVTLDTLDRYCAEKGIAHIDFLKCDVEGHELDVFRGGQSLIAEQRITYIQFEYGGCNIDARTFLADYFAFFTAARYRLYKIFPGHLRFIPRYDQRLDNFQYQNWLVVREDAELPPGLVVAE